MPLSEFELIQQFFTNSSICRTDVALGVGDDCAVLKVPTGKELVVSIDTLVEGIHFLKDLDPELLGHKSLAVNLSDLAAMGAEPAWATLALTLPSVDENWLEGFCRGFARLAAAHNVQLIGGDTTRGPLNISIQAHGFVDTGAALRRDRAQLGDLIYVTGTLGDAGLALHSSEDMNVPAYIQSRLDCPSPRLKEGQALVGLANAAIDISDGLISDLGHICDVSGVGATIYIEDLPCSQAVHDYIKVSDDWSLPLSAGDDYELCFTISPDKQAKVEQLAKDFECGLTKIGRIEPTPGIRCVAANGQQLKQLAPGYEHFSPEG